MKSFHKSVFLVLLVIAPLYWLILTDDGKRRVDTVMLRLFGNDPVDFNILALNDTLTPGELRSVFADLTWHCQDRPTDFGDHLCVSRIGSYNGLPAHYLTLFFTRGQASALKLAYRDIYHDQLVSQLYGQLGNPTLADAPATDGFPGAGILRWKTDHGSVYMQNGSRTGSESTMLWIAGPPGRNGQPGMPAAPAASSD